MIHHPSCANTTTEVIDIGCTWLSRAWWRYIRSFLSPRPCNLTSAEFMIFILTWKQHFQQCCEDNPSRCFKVFSSTISPLLPISHDHPDISLLMVMSKHLESYLSFLQTYTHLNIPKGNWGIIFKPTHSLCMLGYTRLKVAQEQGFTSLYFSSPNPLLLEKQPYEEIVISDDDSDEEPVPPYSSPPRDTIPPSSPSQHS